MKKIISLAFASVFMLSGCATTSVPDARTTVSDFDGTKSVAISPSIIDCVDYTSCGSMGFVWRSNDTDNASALVKIEDFNVHSDYHAISSVRFNVDGDIVTLKPHLGGSNDFKYDDLGNKTTSRLYNVPLLVLNNIKSSTSTKVQIVAEGAVVESDFKDGAENTKAYHAMLKFLEQVEEAK